MTTVLQKLKRIARVVTPMPVRNAWGSVWAYAKARRARRAFASVADRDGGQVLPIEALSDLMDRGYEAPEVIRYDPEGLVLRAREKVTRLAGRVPLDRMRSCVELGCWDGMVLAALRDRQRGITAFGADRYMNGIDARALAAGVRFVQTDAAQLGFASNSVDLVYSFAAFEHFADTRGTMEESWRILRPGGHLYLFFGPVYTSPFGLHAYRQIPVPYCHYLFADADLRTYATREGLPTAWPYVNGVSVTEYRRLWAEQGARFETLFHYEHPSGAVGAELITEYPSCFKSKVPAFDDLLVAAIEICLRKR
jgi:SAM-dependent methyltransferase